MFGLFTLGKGSNGEEKYMLVVCKIKQEKYNLS